MTSTATEYSFTVDGGVTIHANKSPLTFSMEDSTMTLLWTEATPLSWTPTGTAQTLVSTADDLFFGGGMQNGRFAHKGSAINITTSNDWADGGDPNAVPFYVSSSYGVYRNTWAAGHYDFTADDSTVTMHKVRWRREWRAGGSLQFLSKSPTARVIDCFISAHDSKRHTSRC